MRVAFLIPTLNEAQGIRATLARLPRRELEARGYQVEAVVIDGASTDGTADVAIEAGARVIVEPRRGYGRAYKTGLAAVDADFIVTADADGTYPVQDVPGMLETFRDRGFDFATLDRYARIEKGAMTAKHRLGNWILSATARMVFRIALRDSQSGMWILTRQAVKRLPVEQLSDGMSFSQELKIEAFSSPHIAAAELPGGLAPRVGQAKLDSWRDGFGNLRRLVGYRRRRRAHGQA